MKLTELGWNAFFAGNLKPEHAPARVIEQQRGVWLVEDEFGQIWASIPGRLRHDGSQIPAVGDWVGMRGSVIECVLPRRTVFSRHAAGRRTEEQTMAANVDTVFIVTSLNRDLKLSRLERYLSSVYESGARAVILLSKSDLVVDSSESLAEVKRIAAGVDVLAVSSFDGAGLDALEPFLQAGQTIALVGSSGVGKSTLINRLLGHEAQVVSEIREDDGRGRHTTTARRILPLPNGALLLDTPGMREFQLWDSADGMSEAFPEIDALAAECRFRDCKHESEPGCAVLAAIADGHLDERRIQNFRTLGRELQYAAIKQDAGLRAERNKKWRKIQKQVRAMYEARDKPRH